MTRIVASTTIFALFIAAPAHASEPSIAPIAEPVPAAETPAEGPTLDNEPAAPADSELSRLRTRQYKARLAAFGLLGVGSILVGAGGGVASGEHSGGIITRGQLIAGVSIAGVGLGVVLSAIIPAVIARRARKRADLLGSSLALQPAGWVGRGSAGVGLSLRF